MTSSATSSDSASISDASLHMKDYNESSEKSCGNNFDESLTVEERLRRLEREGVDLRLVRQRRLNTKLKSFESLPKKRDWPSRQQALQPLKKRSKHAPTESSSKRSDHIKQKPILTGLGVDVGAHTYKARDPRQSRMSSSGPLGAQQLHRQYEFLVVHRRDEIEQVKQRIVARKTTGRKGQHLRKKLGIKQDTQGTSLEEDKATLKRLQQELADYERQQVDALAKERVKRDLKRERGHEYHAKRSELKKRELEAKFDEIKRRGGARAVNQALSKKRKKNKSRDAARMGRPRADRVS